MSLKYRAQFQEKKMAFLWCRVGPSASQWVHSVWLALLHLVSVEKEVSTKVQPVD